MSAKQLAYVVAVVLYATEIRYTASKHIPCLPHSHNASKPLRYPLSAADNHKACVPHACYSAQVGPSTSLTSLAVRAIYVAVKAVATQQPCVGDTSNEICLHGETAHRLLKLCMLAVSHEKQHHNDTAIMGYWNCMQTLIRAFVEKCSHAKCDLSSIQHCKVHTYKSDSAIC